MAFQNVKFHVPGHLLLALKYVILRTFDGSKVKA
jgi:hypothetical protein